ncbi:MAG: YeeE/YedE family protein [Minicystis sp.]
MKHNAVAFLSGVIFAVGLALSGMTQPSKVLGFLDVAGAWDASLAFVMMAAVGLGLVVFRRVLRRSGPILGGAFHLPDRNDLDARLILGSALFGIGWGLAGYCPGPAFVSLVSGRPGPVIFVGAMLAGIVAHHLVEVVLGAVVKREAGASS